MIIAVHEPIAQRFSNIRATACMRYYNTIRLVALRSSGIGCIIATPFGTGAFSSNNVYANSGFPKREKRSSRMFRCQRPSRRPSTDKGEKRSVECDGTEEVVKTTGMIGVA
ncbi:hypothetical protein EDD85DRAFT_789675 [Armillaria nabsnona]|nr:hypothetical protein EDD85DRAFT_789675 [Armillaria nabsnona]